MVNKIKKFFKSIGKSSSSSSSATGSASMSSTTGYPLLATSDNQFHHQHQQMQERGGYSNNLPLSSSPSYGLAADNGNGLMGTEGSGSGSDSTMASPQRQETIRWGLLLPRIPRLVAEATAAANGVSGGASSPHNASSSGSASQSDDHVEMNLLLEMLTQMAPKELQMQISQYYSGELSAAYSGNALVTSSNTPTGMQSTIYPFLCILF